LEVRKIENDQGRLPSWVAVARPAFVTMIAFAAMRPDVSAHAQRGLFGLYPYYDAPRYRTYDAPRYQVLPPEEVAPVTRKKRAARYPNIPDAPPKGTAKPEGPMTIVVSIARQRVKVYDNNGLFAESPISSGSTGHTTPTGIFSIIQKNKHHRSNLYSNAPMPYMQRITWSGVALHEGVLPGYPASHGCIRLPREFAVKLWSWTKLGVRVVVSNDEVLPADMSHRNLASTSSGPMKISGAFMPTRTAEATTSKVVTDARDDEANPDALVSPTERMMYANNPSGRTWTASPRPAGHLSVFVSRKDQRLYVRQGFEPWFDMPITITDSDAGIGTHVFHALPVNADASALRWTALSIPDAPKPQKISVRRGEKPPAVQPAVAPRVTAAEALDRINIPAEALERIGSAWKPGSSLVISDQGLGTETGRGTDFIVVTH
jgi:lipoprotein-anchoring transpeptidase ErfK/SrfK